MFALLASQSTITSPVFEWDPVFKNQHFLLYNSRTAASLNLVFCNFIETDHTLLPEMLGTRHDNEVVERAKSDSNIVIHSS